MDNNLIKTLYRIKSAYNYNSYYWSVDQDWDEAPSYACIFDSKKEAIEFAINNFENEIIIIEEFYKL